MPALGDGSPLHGLESIQAPENDPYSRLGTGLALCRESLKRIPDDLLYAGDLAVAQLSELAATEPC